MKWQAKDFFLKTHVEFFDQSFRRMMKYQAKQIFLNNPHCGTFFYQRFGKNEEMPSQRHFLN
jgi:hypothetical protein